MPNIAITTYCNLKCPYCFANTMIQENAYSNISITQLTKILQWLDQSKQINNMRMCNKSNERIGIIGGEPTLHPQFAEIMSIINNYCIARNLSSILFTNGIFLYKYIKIITKNNKILININDPATLSNQQFQQLMLSLNKAEQLDLFNQTEQDDKPITLGCNICQEIQDYDFIFRILKMYNIKILRISVTAPIILISKDNYYLKMKDIFLNFVQRAKKDNVILTLDCNQIPSCYFSSEEINLIKQQTVEHYDHNFKNGITCDPTIDITPDFKASACFGAYELVDCNNFNNLEELRYYLLNKYVMPKYIANNSGKCQDCKEHEFFKCQGGCLAFSKLKKEGVFND